MSETPTGQNLALPWTITNDHRSHVDIIDAREKSVFEQIRPEYAAYIVKAANHHAGSVEVLRDLEKLGASVAADIRETHKARGDGASDWMREDDRDLRADFNNVLASARALLSEVKEG